VKEWLEKAYGEKINFRQYDIELNANYYFLDLTSTVFSPYTGAGVQAGFTSFSPEGFEDESEIKVAGSLNFGADLKLFDNGRSFLTVASMNNYNLLASDNRPKYLNLGFALRYFFR
jgi:outer membrane protein W